MTSTRPDWRTPRALFLALHERHKFTLDAAASRLNTQLPTFYSAKSNALTQTWAPHRVWLNPPYGRDIGQWMQKAADAETLVVALVPARTDTAWWHKHVMPRAAEVAFVSGRLRFEGAASSAPFPSALITYQPGQQAQRVVSVDKLGAPI